MSGISRRRAAPGNSLLPRHTVHAGKRKTTGPIDDEPVPSGYMDKLVLRLQQLIDQLSNPATLRGGQLILTDPMRSTDVLQVGDVYVDENGFLKIFLPGLFPATGVSAAASVSSVTVVIT